MTDFGSPQEVESSAPDERREIDKLPPESKFLAHLRQYQVFEGGPGGMPESLDMGYFEGNMRALNDFKPRAVNKPGYEEDEAEAGMVVYWDPDERKIGSSMTTDGLTTEVNLNVREVLMGGREPLLELHTHPGGQELPSVDDWYGLLQGDPETGWRVVRAMVILMPEAQLLAVATDQTPIYDPEEIKAVMSKYANEESSMYVGVQEKARRRHEKIELIKEDMIRECAQRHLAQGRFDIGEVEAIYNKSQKVHDKILSTALGKIEDSRISARRIQRQVIDDFKIKLYKSTDFRNFSTFDPSEEIPLPE